MIQYWENCNEITSSPLSVLKTFSVICFPSYFPDACTNDLFPVILHIRFHSYLRLTMYILISPIVPGVSSCLPTPCFAVLFLSVLSSQNSGHAIMHFGEKSHVTPTLRVSHSHMTCESCIIEWAAWKTDRWGLQMWDCFRLSWILFLKVLISTSERINVVWFLKQQWICSLIQLSLKLFFIFYYF